MSTRTITPQDAVVEFGAIVFQNDFSVIRAKSVRKPNGTWFTQIIVHRKEGTVEQLPRGYILGHNMLRFAYASR